MPEHIVLYLVIAVIALIIALFLQNFMVSRRNEESLRKLKDDIYYHVAGENRFLREELEGRLDRLRDSLMQVFEAGRDSNRKAISSLSQEIHDAMHNFLSHTTNGLEGIRASVDEKLTGIQASNEKKLDEMRTVVNEKLEKTLETRLQKSFETVSSQLESVNRGLGEMKTVAQSVGSLNRILAGSKSRGILGEVQLGQIIEDMLPSQLYEKEISVKVGSKGRVDYAVKLPGAGDGGHVYLPIDSKFPLETYERLLDCYEIGIPEEIEIAKKELFKNIKAFAKDIREKYISPPETTDFAVMFLPTEGLYAEIARDASFFESLRQDNKIIIAGPTTFAAMLNSLQLGFKTLQIQKTAADIEKTLGAVKHEFETFEGVLRKAKEKIKGAGKDIDFLMDTRTNVINRKLRDVQTYTGEENLLGLSYSDEFYE
jgi:DNA recombination protein RmuC